jgi:hypothetical protein
MRALPDILTPIWWAFRSARGCNPVTSEVASRHEVVIGEFHGTVKHIACMRLALVGLDEGVSEHIFGAFS